MELATVVIHPASAAACDKRCRFLTDGPRCLMTGVDLDPSPTPRRSTDCITASRVLPSGNPIDPRAVADSAAMAQHYLQGAFDASAYKDIVRVDMTRSIKGDRLDVYIDGKPAGIMIRRVKNEFDELLLCIHVKGEPIANSKDARPGKRPEGMILTMFRIIDMMQDGTWKELGVDGLR